MTELLLAFINVCFLSKKKQKSLLYLCIIKCCVFFFYLDSHSMFQNLCDHGKTGDSNCH